MKLSSFKKSIGVAVIAGGVIIGSTTFQLARADTSSDCCDQINQLINLVSDGFSSITNMINNLYASVLTFSSEVSAKSALGTVLENNWVDADTNKAATADTRTTLTISHDAATAQAINAAALVPISPNDSVDDKLPNFTASSLLGQKALDPSTSDGQKTIGYAKEYIGFLSGHADVIQSLPGSYMTLTSSAVVGYKNALGTYTATQSLALESLYRLLSRRIVQPGLGTTAGMKQANVSPYQLDEYMATANLTPDWNTKVLTANPGDVQKQIALSLGAIQTQLYQTRLQNEELNTLLATLLLQQQQGITKDKLTELFALAMKSKSST